MFLAASMAARLFDERSCQSKRIVITIKISGSIRHCRSGSSNCRRFFSWHFVFQAVVWVSMIASVGLAIFRKICR